MHPKSPTWLEHVARACAAIVEFTQDRSLLDYEHNLLLRSAVERQFQIIGEALLRIERSDPTVANRISTYREIIGFRNRLIHGYDNTDDAIVWGIIQGSLPLLRNEVMELLGEIDGS